MTQRFPYISHLKQNKIIIAIFIMMVLLSSAIVYAQIEGPPRGVLPVASNGDFEVTGIEVDVTADNAFEARTKGWQEAQRLGWQKLWARTRGGNGGSLSDSSLDSMVSSIVIEEEQIGPNRYIATLGVIFDRARAGQLLGVKGISRRSAPLLILPITISGGAPILYERRTEWQKAWARFRTSDSSIDYVRPSGAGAESLLLNAGQINRRSASWWRLILDEFGAADIVSASARFERQYPGGPIKAYFTARYGPDNIFIGRFALSVSNKEAIPAMMDTAVKRMDDIFQQALASGNLSSKKSLILEDSEIVDKIEESEENSADAVSSEAVTDTPDSNNIAPVVETPSTPATPEATVQTFSVQYSTPDSAAVDRGQGALRAIAGVRSVSTSSLALGGTSVMRVNYAGDAAALRSALAANGWRVGGSGNIITISR